MLLRSACTLVPREREPTESRRIAATGPRFLAILLGEVLGDEEGEEEERFLDLPRLGILSPCSAAAERRSDPEETWRNLDRGFFWTRWLEMITAPDLPGDQDMGSNSCPSKASSLGDEMPRGDETVSRGGVERFLSVGLIWPDSESSSTDGVVEEEDGAIA